ncbi:MAG: hypothetical protein JRN59_07060, partial [Nitrososphaerota archaeon]|nr:hypothetical protein [Nitrososphaerota archaeon]
TAVAYPPVIDLSAKIVEVGEGETREFRAKRGGLGGRKAVYRGAGFRDTVSLDGSPRPKGSAPMLKQVLKKGRLAGGFEEIDAIRARVRTDLDRLSGSNPALVWR